ncbi:two-component system, OmpR family, sensor histidine kinase KdpD [Thermoflexales bacterium]|nr:two-component system, OmpR family, sensor histidine kinase KdpD [Thermoflexales bacterium]
MLKSYAVRYGLSALLLSLAAAFLYAVIKLMEVGRAIAPREFFTTVGPAYWLVLTLLLTFAALAYGAGKQRDRAVALARERETLTGILSTLMHAPDPDLEQSLPRVLQQIAAVVSAEEAALLTLDHEQWVLRAATSQTLPALLQLPKALPWPPVDSRQIIACEARPEESVALTSADLPRVTACVAVYSEAQPLGWLVLVKPRTQVALGDAADLLITLADQIGAALARSRQYALVRRRARDLEAITQTNRLLLAGMGLDELLTTIVNSAQVRFGLPYVTVMWIDEVAGDFYIRAQAGPLVALAVPNFRQKLTTGLAAQVLRTGQPYLARDTRQEPDYIPAVSAAIRSLLLTPLKTAERVIGVMTFESLAVEAFSAEEVSALTALTDQAAIAAENAALLIEAQRERQRASAILHSARDVVVLIDTADRVQLLNPAAERLLGVSAATAVGRPIEQLLTFPSVLEAYQRHTPNSEEQSFEAPLDNGQTYLVTITIAKDETGAHLGRVVIMRDITYLKRLDQFKSQMVQMTSHDLRTPLGVAIGYLDLLKDDLQPATPFRERALQGLEAALNRMQTLVTELLDLERVEAGTDRLRVRVDVGSLAAEAVAEFEEMAQTQQQQLEFTLPHDLPSIRGDPARLKQAIGNLINNAVKYTPDGGSIWVRVRPDDQRVLIEVQDTGYGIPAAAQAKLFQRFYRVRIPGAENIAGTGLGLSLVKAIVEQHGGRVSAESEEGKGSTFRIWLPMADGENG